MNRFSFLPRLLLSPAPIEGGSLGKGGGDREPGSISNRLSIDPNDSRWPDVAGWEDGKEYNVKATLTQISPGEFEVTALSTEAAPEEGGGEAAAPETSDDAAPTANPAVAALE